LDVVAGVRDETWPERQQTGGKKVDKSVREASTVVTYELQRMYLAHNKLHAEHVDLQKEHERVLEEHERETGLLAGRMAHAQATLSTYVETFQDRVSKAEKQVRA
jgi:hypothetical protein